MTSWIIYFEKKIWKKSKMWPQLNKKGIKKELKKKWKRIKKELKKNWKRIEIELKKTLKIKVQRGKGNKSPKKKGK